MQTNMNKIVKFQDGFTKKQIIINTLVVLLALAIFLMIIPRKEETIKISEVFSLWSGTSNCTVLFISDSRRMRKFLARG